MLKIKDLKQDQVFYGKSSDRTTYRFKVWMEPVLVNNVWTVDCTDEGDYCFTFNEDDQDILYLTLAETLKDV